MKNVKKSAIKNVKPLKCANCERVISSQEKKNNDGYCNECAFEAWGEGEPS